MIDLICKLIDFLLISAHATDYYGKSNFHLL